MHHCGYSNSTSSSSKSGQDSLCYITVTSDASHQDQMALVLETMSQLNGGKHFEHDHHPRNMSPSPVPKIGMWSVEEEEDNCGEKGIDLVLNTLGGGSSIMAMDVIQDILILPEQKKNTRSNATTTRTAKKHRHGRTNPKVSIALEREGAMQELPE